MKNIWSLLSALFFVLSALCLPPVSSLAIPPRRGLRSYSPLSRSPSQMTNSSAAKHLALLFLGREVQSEILRSAPLRSE